ncbi:MAG: hypothetical protein ACOX2F_02840 [bacterium]
MENEKTIEKLVNFFNALFNYSVGTLWFIKEELIKTRVQDYDPNSDRVGHPAVSIRKTLLISLEKIPMLTGSSKNRGNNFLVKGIFHENSENWFGSCLVPLLVKDFWHGKIPEKPRSPKERAMDRPYIKMIEKNDIKPQLDESEQINFKKWLEKRGYK